MYVLNTIGVIIWRQSLDLSAVALGTATGMTVCAAPTICTWFELLTATGR